MKFCKSRQRGEIAVLLTIAVLLVVGATTFISSLALKGKKTVSTKAVDVCNSSTIWQCSGGRRCKVKAPAGVLVYYFESDNSCLPPTSTPEPQQNPPIPGVNKGNECGSGGPNYKWGSCYKGSRCVQCQHGGKWLAYNCFEIDSSCPASSDQVYCASPWVVTACKDGGHMCCSGGNCLKNGNTGTETISISKCTDSDSFCSSDEYCSNAGGICGGGGPLSTPSKVCDASVGKYCCIKPTRMPDPTARPTVTPTLILTPIPSLSPVPTSIPRTDGCDEAINSNDCKEAHPGWIFKWIYNLNKQLCCPPSSTKSSAPTTVPPDSCIENNDCINWCSSYSNIYYDMSGNSNKYSYKQMADGKYKYYRNNDCSGNFINDNLPLAMGSYCGCTDSGNPTATKTPAPSLPPALTSTQTLPSVPIVPTGDYSAGQQICLLNGDTIKCGMNKGERTSNAACVTKNGWKGTVTESVVCKKPLDKTLPCDFFYQKNDSWIPMNKQVTINDNICDLNQDQIVTVNLSIDNKIEVLTKKTCLIFWEVFTPPICSDGNNPLTFSLKKNDRPKLIEVMVTDKNQKTYTEKKELQNLLCYLGFCKHTEELEKDYNIDVTYPKQ